MSITRRDLLRGAGAAALLSALPRGLSAQGDPAYGGFKMGLQTYTLRDFDFDATLGHLKTLGIKYAQFFSKQLPITDDKSKIEAAKEKLKAAGIQILSWGVQGFSKNVENHFFALAIYFMLYNYVRIHETLRVTPAMTAGVSETL